MTVKLDSIITEPDAGGSTMLKCPCEECICLAVCKCRIRSTRGIRRDFSSVLKCELLSEYLPSLDNRIAHANYWTKIDATRLVYGLKPLFRDWYSRKAQV